MFTSDSLHSLSRLLTLATVAGLSYDYNTATSKCVLTVSTPVEGQTPRSDAQGWTPGILTLSDTFCLLSAQVRNRLGEANDPKVRNKLTQLLQYAARGVQANPSATVEDVLVFVHAVLSDGLQAEEAARARAQAAAQAAILLTLDEKAAAAEAAPTAAAAHELLLVEFALTLFQRWAQLCFWGSQCLGGVSGVCARLNRCINYLCREELEYNTTI